MNLDEVIAQRRSVREYRGDKEVTKEQVRELIKSAQQAPSWKNSQTGRYYAIFNKDKMMEVRAQLVEQNQIVTKDVNAVIVSTFVKNRSGFNREGQAENELGNGWGCYDLGLQNAFLILKATDLGIDSIILGLRDAKGLRRVLNIPDTEEVVSVIALGYKKEIEILAPKRKELDSILTVYE